MLSSRRHRDRTSTSHKYDYKLWNQASDTERPRTSTESAQRPNIEYGPGTAAAPERQHRASRRAESSGVAPSVHKYSATRDEFNSAAPSQHTIPPTASQPASTSAAPSGTRETGAYDLRTYLRKKTEKRSPRSSEEKVYVPEQSTSSRPTHQARSGYPSASSQVPSSTQTYWIPPQSARDPVSMSSRQYGEGRRERDRDEPRERRRERPKASEKPIEQDLKQGVDRGKETTLTREMMEADLQAEQMRDAERRRRRERRAEKERLLEQEQRRDDTERLRRHKDRPTTRDKDPRMTDEYNTVYSQVAQNPTSQASKRYEDDRTSARPFLTDQVPSSSSNIALPSTAQLAASGRHPTSSDPRSELASRAAPPQVPEKERRPHRSHRQKTVLSQQNAQESGVSSSEQEHSGRERSIRYSERRHVARDYDGDAHPSGPSGSETERLGIRERRKLSRANDSHFKEMENRQQSANTAYGYGNVPPSAQNTASVGPASFQRFTPQIVSIRAGQGPADPQTPLPRTKTPMSSSQTRPREQPREQPAAPAPSHQATLQGPSFQGQMSHSYSASQAASRPSGHQVSSSEASRAQGLHLTQQVVAPSSGGPQPSSQDPSRVYSNQDGPTTAAHAVFPDDGSRRQKALPQQPSTQINYLTVPSMNMPPTVSTSGASSRKAPSPAQPTHSPSLSNAPDSSPVKPSDARLKSSTDHSPGHYAKLSISRSPGPTVSAELIIPLSTTASQQANAARAAPQDLGARFPLNEDMLTSASSSTLAPGTGRSATLSMLPAQGHQFDSPMNNSRSATYPPLLDGISHSNGVAIPMSPVKYSTRAFQEENDIPIPVPGPRAVDAMQGYPPSAQASRPQTTPVQSRPATTSIHIAVPSYLSPEVTRSVHQSTGQVQQNQVAPSNPVLTAVANMSNHSPSRSTKRFSQYSPGTLNAAPLSGTPKHSPSGRLPPRNGSTDTVTQIQPPAKSSPVPPGKSLTQRTSNSNLQSHVPSRTDMNPPQPSNWPSEYPDSSRYRSSAPYPTPIQQAPPTNTTPTGYTQSTTPHYSRSSNQPVPSTFEYQAATHRHPAPNPAAAPSASAIAAAYRSGLYNTEQSSLASHDTASHKVPSRSAPSPVPTIIGRQYNPTPSILSKTGYATSPMPTQPTRGQTYPIPSGARPQGAPQAAVSHSRTLSDPQNPNYSTRVPISGHPSTPAPPKAQLAFHPSPSEQELLRTPSSIARSISKGGQAPHPSARPSASASQNTKPSSKDKDPRKKAGGFFGLFRSRSSPPKEEDARSSKTPGSNTASQPVKTRQRSSSQTTLNAVAASVRNIVAPHPTPMRAPPPSPAGPPPPQAISTQIPAPPPTVVAPTPVKPVHDHVTISGPKMFSAFKLTSKRNRTMSAASIEALDGTAANTVIGGESARSSTAGRPSPPLRDPIEATHSWRLREEIEHRDRGWRRPRPGVVFDVVDEFTETETHHAAGKRGPRR